LKHHVIITGTGRTGTTFLVELLTNLGLDTGFSTKDIPFKKRKEARAGLEHDLRRKGRAFPYIVKNPMFCDYAEEIICRDDIIIEHIFVPIRELHAAAESRRYVTKVNISNEPIWKRLKYTIRPKLYAGGLLHTRSMEPGKQEDILLKRLYKLMFVLSDKTIPITFMRYPRIVKDCRYLFSKLKPILKNITFKSFSEAFNKTVQPKLIHSFSKKDL
jgi:hypothetical protein